jgi:hypothetical protein
MNPVMGWPGRAQRLVCESRLRRRYAKLEEHAMRTSQKTLEPITKDRGRTPSHYLIGGVQDRDLLDAAMLDRGRFTFPQEEYAAIAKSSR